MDSPPDLKYPPFRQRLSRIIIVGHNHLPIASREISTLNHKPLDRSVESGSFVVSLLSHLSHSRLAGTQGAEVLSGLGDDFISLEHLF